jgi:hypothetical protein
MYVDALLALSGSISGNTVTGQTATGTDTSVLSTNTIDLGVARDIGEGEPLFGRWEVTTAASGGTSVEFQVIGATAANLGTGVVVLGTTGAIAVASITAAAKFACAIRPNIGSLGLRYLGLRYVTVGAVAAGGYYGDVGKEVADFKTYASGFAVL